MGIYIGVIKWKGELHEGKFTPLITPDLFKKVQSVLKNRSKPRKTKTRHEFAFRGHLRCTCGASITAQWGKGHGGIYRYYRCTRKSRECHEPYIQEQDLAAQIVAKLAPLALKHEEAEQIRALIRVEEADESGTISTALKKAIAELAAVQEKLDCLTRAYLDPEEGVDTESFQTVKAELVLQKTTLKAEKERLQKRRTHPWIEPARNVISTLETLGNMPDAASSHEIARLFKKIGSNPLLANKTVNFSFGEDYDFLPSLLASARVAANSAESKRHGDLPQSSQSSEWCAVEVSNL